MTTFAPSQLVSYKNGAAGAVTREQWDKNGDVVCVKDFGADASGTNDSTSAIQAAITYVLGLPNGGAVYMPAGTYRVSSTINIPFTTNVSFTLYGDGRGTQIKYAGSAFPNILNVGGGTNLFGTEYVFKDFSFAQPYNGSATGTNAAIFFNNMNGALIDNVEIYNYANGLSLQSSFYTRVINSRFYGNSNAAISTVGTGTNALYIDKTGFQANVTAVYLGVGGNNIAIRDSNFEGNGTSLNMTGYTSVLFEGNYVELGTAPVFAFGTGCKQVDIVQNWLGQNGVNTQFSNVVGGKLEKNTIYNSTWTWDVATISDFTYGINYLLGTSSIASSPWNSVTLSNNWTVGATTPGYRVMNDNIVRLRGQIIVGTGSLGSTAFTLPVGYRPSQNLVIPGINSTSNSVSAIYVNTNGTVMPASSGGAVGNAINLDGVSFLAN